MCTYNILLFSSLHILIIYYIIYRDGIKNLPFTLLMSMSTN